MKTLANVIILSAVLATVFLTSCNASRKAGCDAYGSNQTELKSDHTAR